MEKTSPESPRRSSSPEFEFWMVGNPSFPKPHLLDADELFAGGVLLPLQPLPNPPLSSTPSPPHPPPPPPLPCKKWTDFFKQPERRKGRNSSANAAAAELNIHIWPFSRSRSAGYGGRTTMAVAGRKSTSAPCSRSNSRGEEYKTPVAAATTTTTSKRWGPIPARGGIGGGIHLGRTGPVWKLRRTSKGSESKEKGADEGKKVLGLSTVNLNVNTCIGYGSKARCRGEDKERITGSDQIDGGSTSNSCSGAGGSLFNIRTIFSKKVY